jgi:hypothetical protein
MKIFTEKGFREELKRRREEEEESRWMRERFHELERKVESIEITIEKMRYNLSAERKED